ncbi:MAG: UDP-N-acetylglucosamine 1-carboxyvinyltransferase [Holosporales bacterium]|jgi:UDP-N-acetylglucosamine 1-carboxyvinyltransferase|nr:UDP-N-acetylglucosamine 1-carboxyvinyltransferase [Holosporales bacterium]
MLQSIRIRGGVGLNGAVDISGAKNLALPALVTTLLTSESVTLTNVPDLADVRSLLGLLSHLGTDIKISDDKHTVTLQTKNLRDVVAPYDFVRKMRASILVLGPLVARHRMASVSFPGGCAIGTRGIDLHIKALRLLGADVKIENGYINAEAPGRLTGAEINFSIPTVTGTENSIMAAVLANGTTTIINAAMEPEIPALVELLNGMGARITGHGTSVISIDGVESLHGTSYEVIPDRIEAGTYAVAAAATCGKLILKNCNHGHLLSFFETLHAAGVACDATDDGVLAYRRSNELCAVDIQTAPYPGFPTDLQAQYMALMSLSTGTASITENIFENRFMHVPELCRMGANIAIHGKTAIVTGVKKLNGAQVMATDIRASVSLVIAGLAAEGETVVNRLYHIDRGYENIDEKMRNCGADVERISV